MKRTTRPAKRTPVSAAADTHSDLNKDMDKNTSTARAEKPPINIADSGFLGEVIKRDYAENGGANPSEEQTPAAEPAPAPDQTPAEPAPEQKRSFLGERKVVIQEVDPQKEKLGSRIDEMQYLPPLDTSADAASVNEQIGQKIGMTTSELAFGYLEKLYPEVIAYFIKIDQGFVTEAGLPTDLELSIVKKILEQNRKNKDKIAISDFHRKNILPPLQSILAKKGWEDVIPDEVQLVIALCVLAADTFWKVREIRQEMGVFKQEIGIEIHKYTEEVAKTVTRQDQLEKQLADMQEMVSSMVANKKGGVS